MAPKSETRKKTATLSARKPDVLRDYSVTDADGTPHDYVDVRVVVTDDGGLVLIGPNDVVQAMFAPNYWASVELTGSEVVPDVKQTRPLLDTIES